VDTLAVSALYTPAKARTFSRGSDLCAGCSGLTHSSCSFYIKLLNLIATRQIHQTSARQSSAADTPATTAKRLKWSRM